MNRPQHNCSDCGASKSKFLVGRRSDLFALTACRSFDGCTSDQSILFTSPQLHPSLIIKSRLSLLVLSLL